jgi:hypothetical protein
MRREIIEALRANAEGAIKKHKMNVEIYLANPVGIGEHPDVLSAIEAELDRISHYHDQLEVIEKYIE